MPEIMLDKAEAHSMNLKFTFLLVALFVIVNAGLVAILDNDKADTVSAVSVPTPKGQNNIVRLPDAQPYVKSEDSQPLSVATPVEPAPAPAKPVEATPAQAAPVEDVSVQEKPQLDTPEAGKPELAGQPAPVAAAPQKPADEKPSTAKPEEAAPKKASPAAGADLLSIIDRQ
ncbi:MAG TPA: hypothetical protein VFT64_10760 [Rickettsiales bacterium]|nr:hypothetical protein [Rickettsiales bacterium]